MELHEKALLTTLSNGLQLIILPMPYAPVAAVMTSYRAGSAMEDDGTRGLSHFVEHMMFKGTPGIPGSRFWGVIQSFGGMANAFTSRDLTAYYELLPASGAERVFELESDRMSSLVFDEAEVLKERAVIFEERRTASVESAAGAIDEALFLQALPNHPYGKPITGFDSDISSFDCLSASEFYGRFYNPSNAVVTVAGRIDPDQIRASIERHFGSLRTGTRASYPVIENPWGPPGRERISHPSDLPRLSIAFPAPPSDHEDWPLLEMAATWLSGTRSSRLDEMLVHGGIALGVSAGGFFSACPGIFSVRASLYPDADIVRTEALIMQEIDALGSRPIGEADFEDLKVQQEVLTLMEHANPVGAASDLALSLSVMGRISHQSEISARIQKASPDDLRAACARWLNPSRAVFVELAPSGSKPEMIDFEGKAGRGDISPPGSIDLSEIEISPGMLEAPAVSVSSGIETRTLANGLSIILRKDDTFPLVSLAFSIPLASGREPLEKAGLAAVTSEAMAYGTEDEDYIRFNARIERRGSDLSMAPGPEHTIGVLTLHSRDMGEGLSFMSDLLRRPAFRSGDLDRVVAEKITELQHRSETPFGIAMENLALDMSSPREAAGVPTRSSLASITRDDVVSFQRSCSRPDGAFLVAVGSFDREEILAEIERQFGDWRKPESMLPELGFPAVPPEGVRSRASMKGRTQTAILLGTEAPDRNSDQFYTFRLLSRILGDGMNSRLENRIREQNGLAYQVGCEHVATAGNGRFVAYLATSDDSATLALDMVEHELDIIREELPDAKEVDLFKASSVGRQSMTLLDYDSLALYLVNNAASGRPMDQDLRAILAILETTPEMLRQAALRWLAPKARFISLAGGVCDQDGGSS